MQGMEKALRVKSQVNVCCGHGHRYVQDLRASDPWRNGKAYPLHAQNDIRSKMARLSSGPCLVLIAVQKMSTVASSLWVFMA